MRFFDYYVYIYLGIVVSLFGLVQYIVLRTRNSRAIPPDPQIGRKFILGYFLHLAILLLLAGLTVSSLDWSEHLFEPMVEAQKAKKDAEAAKERGEDPPMNPAAGLPPPVRDKFNEKQRTAAGLVASGFFHILIFWPLLRFATNAKEFPAVGRSFIGLRLFLCGLTMMTLTTISLVGVFQKGETDLTNASIMVGLAGVWGPAALIHFVALLVSHRWHVESRKETED